MAVTGPRIAYSTEQLCSALTFRPPHLLISLLIRQAVYYTHYQAGH